VSYTGEFKLQDFTEFHSHHFHETNSITNETNSIRLIANEQKSVSTVTQQLLKRFWDVLEVHDAHYIQEASFSISLNKTNPIKPWRQARPETVDKFSGLLVRSIPALEAVSEDELNRIVDEFRKR
jgi:acetolactate synthase regulatory subunit